MAELSSSIRLDRITNAENRSSRWPRPTTPRGQRLRPYAPPQFGLFPFRSPLLWESLLLSLPPGTEMFQFPGFASGESPDDRVHPGQVSPFGHPRIKACLRLPEAFRSLPRPSSPVCAKASTPCPESLEFSNSSPCARPFATTPFGGPQTCAHSPLTLKTPLAPFPNFNCQITDPAGPLTRLEIHISNRPPSAGLRRIIRHIT